MSLEHKTTWQVFEMVVDDDILMGKVADCQTDLVPSRFPEDGLQMDGISTRPRSTLEPISREVGPPSSAKGETFFFTVTR